MKPGVSHLADAFIQSKTNKEQCYARAVTSQLNAVHVARLSLFFNYIINKKKTEQASVTMYPYKQ